jgi:hypothetical protein
MYRRRTSKLLKISTNEEEEEPEERMNNNIEPVENVEEVVKQDSICTRIICKMNYILSISKVYLVWILIHYATSQCYVKFCTPPNIYGFIMSPLLSSAPHCKAMRWAIYTGANTIESMWIIIGTWICAKMVNAL